MSEEKAVKKAVDWVQIQIDYRAGAKPLRLIASENGITHGAITQRAKKEDWLRGSKPERLDKGLSKVVLTPVDEMQSSVFIYVIYIDTGVERLYKIGMSKSFGSRFDQHQCSSPFEICVAICYFTGNMRVEERDLHTIHAGSRIRGEWFRLDASDLRSIAERALLV